MSEPRVSRSNQVLFDSAVLDSILPFLHDRALLSLGLACRSFSVYLRYAKSVEMTEARWRCDRTNKQLPPQVSRRAYHGDGYADCEACPSPAWSRAVSAVGVVVHSGSSLAMGSSGGSLVNGSRRPTPVPIPRVLSVAQNVGPESEEAGLWKSLRKWFSSKGKSTEPRATRRGRSRDAVREISRNDTPSGGREDSDGSKSRDSSPSLEAPWWRLEQHQVDELKDSLGAGSSSLPSTPTALARRNSTKKEEHRDLSTNKLDSLYRKKLQRDESSKRGTRRSESPKITRDLTRLGPNSFPHSTPIAISKDSHLSSIASSSPSFISSKINSAAPFRSSSLVHASCSSAASSFTSVWGQSTATPSPSSSPPSRGPSCAPSLPDTVHPFAFAAASSSSSASSPSIVATAPSSLSHSSPMCSSSSPCLPSLDSLVSSLSPVESIQDLEEKRIDGRKELVPLPDEPQRDLTFWNEVVLDRWSIVKDSPLVIKIWDRDGVPASMRGAVWALAIGNIAEVSLDAYLSVRRDIEESVPNLEKDLVTGLPAGWTMPTSSSLTLPDISPVRSAVSHGSRSHVLSPRHSFGSSRNDSIDADLLRMFPKMKHSWMEMSGTLWCNLRELLQAFCSFRPDISYIQGMSYLAAVFLVYMPPEKAFVCLVNLIRRDYFPSYMQMDALHIRVRFQVFEAVFEANLPALFQKFAQDNLLPDCYLMEWLLTLFSKQLPLDIVSRIWDNYLLHGEVYVFKVACALLALLQRQLIDKTANECMRTLRGAFTDFTEHQVLSATSQVVIPPAVQHFYDRRKLDTDYCEFDPLVIHTSETA